MGCRELQLNNYFHFSGDNLSNHEETEVNEKTNGNGFNHPRKFVFIRGSEGFQTIVTNPNVTNPNAHVMPESGIGGTAAYLLYDGHGSTRLLTDSTSSIANRFDYDAYGKNLFSANVTNPSGIDMLYSGEQFDTNLQMQYLRARYYDQNNGRFNRLDDYMGSNSDPQSLHKYAYAHSNPVMMIDPTGMMTLSELFTVQGAIAFLQMYWIHITVASFTAGSVIGNYYFWRYRRERIATFALLNVGKKLFMDTAGFTRAQMDENGPENAALHTLTNIIAVRSGNFKSPEQALTAFQDRETGENSASKMDMKNNILGNRLATQFPEESAFELVKRSCELTWLDPITGVETQGRLPETIKFKWKAMEEAAKIYFPYYNRYDKERKMTSYDLKDLFGDLDN